MHRVVLTDKRFYDPELINQDKGKKAKKVKLSMMESFKYIFASSIKCILFIPLKIEKGEDYKSFTFKMKATNCQIQIMTS
jgi:hypothetical protein